MKERAREVRDVVCFFQSAQKFKSRYATLQRPPRCSDWPPRGPSPQRPSRVVLTRREPRSAHNVGGVTVRRYENRAKETVPLSEPQTMAPRPRPRSTRC